MSITPYGMYVALTPQHKPEHPRDVDASYVQVRVGGGWLELDTWLDARIEARQIKKAIVPRSVVSVVYTYKSR